jgi:hypothetical protein
MASRNESGRRAVPGPERLKLWVRAGGRCEICNRYLLEGQLAFRELTFGEAAHIIGQLETEKSPRGLDDDLGLDRDNADNLMLVCDDEHDEIDKAGSRDAFTGDFLRAMKHRHEDRIRLTTGFTEYHGTTPLRMIGWLRGNPVEVSRDTVASAVMRGAGRFPRFDLSTRNTLEIDLRGLPGEADGGPDYYSTAKSKIDQIIDHKVADAVAAEEISHLSVFAFARLPLLVYLGTKLDDTVPIDIYQRHRSTEDWQWPDPSAAVTFEVDTSDPAASGEEAVLIMNISGSIERDELPEAVQGMPHFKLSVEGIAHPDVFAGPNTLTAFAAACRRLLAEIEKGHKRIRLLHVFAAMPLSSGVTFGRVFDPDVHPTIAIYDRTHHGYMPALEVGNR